MRRPDAAALIATTAILPALIGCASLGTSTDAGGPALVGESAIALPTDAATAPLPTAPAPAASAPAVEPQSPLSGDDTAQQLFDRVAGTVTVDGTDFHQIRYTPAADGRPADVMYGTDQWEAHVADNTQPIGPIIIVRVTEQTHGEVLRQAGAAPSAARVAARDPFTPVEPEADNPSGQEQRLVVVPPAKGPGGLLFATTGVPDADVRAFVEAVTR